MITKTKTNPYRGVNLQLGCESTSRSFQLGMGAVIVKTDCCRWIVCSSSVQCSPRPCRAAAYAVAALPPRPRCGPPSCTRPARCHSRCAAPGPPARLNRYSRYYWKCFYTQYFSITEICFYELQNAVFYFWMKL